jgi:3-isopropylmalate dehydrogenase
MARIAVIAGDGIGPEVMAEALPLLEWARGRGRELEWKSLPYGADHYLETGETLPDWAFQDIRDAYDAVLFGAVGDPRVPDGAHAEGILLRLRRDLELGVNFRPCQPILERLLPLRGVRADEVHLEVFRENTEGPYCLVGRTEPGWAVDEAHHSETAVEILLRAAFQRAAERTCTLTLAHKANVLKHGHGLWMRVYTRLQRDFPGVQSSALHADALLCALVQNPRPFGVIAADNLFGDLISDLLAAFQGGMGLAASANVAPHRPYRCSGLFEPVHGSAPALTGKKMANPCGMILSTALMFRHLGWEAEALGVETAVREALEDGMATPDIDGSLTTSELGWGIRSRLPNRSA